MTAAIALLAQQRADVDVNLTLPGILALVLILIVPRLLNYVVAIYLIVVSCCCSISGSDRRTEPRRPLP